MRVRFTADYDYKPTSQSTIGYRAGMTCVVKRECGEGAIAAGKAEEVKSLERRSDGEE